MGRFQRSDKSSILLIRKASRVCSNGKKGRFQRSNTSSILVIRLITLVVQLVEQWSPKPKVVGPSPAQCVL